MRSSVHGCSIVKLFRFSLFCLLLTGCAKSTFETELEDYNVRLARVLDQQVPQSAGLSVNKLPDPRDLKRVIPTLDIDLLEFLRLGQCELQGVIAEKNSSLGRFAADSIALNQDLQFLSLSQQCLSSLENESLIQTLSTAVEVKRRDLPLRIWNAIFAGAEYREFWSGDLQNYPAVVESQMQFALTELQLNTNAVMAGQDEAFDHQSFEEALSVLRSGEAGALLRSWRLVQQHLEVATTIVAERVKVKPLCFGDMRNPKAEYFRNLVVGQFAGVIQRDIAVLNRRYYEVILPLQALELSFVDVETDRYREFRQARDRQFTTARDEVKAHVAALEPLMVQCGFLASKNEL